MAQSTVKWDTVGFLSDDEITRIARENKLVRSNYGETEANWLEWIADIVKVKFEYSGQMRIERVRNSIRTGESGYTIFGTDDISEDWTPLGKLSDEWMRGFLTAIPCKDFDYPDEWFSCVVSRAFGYSGDFKFFRQGGFYVFYASEPLNKQVDDQAALPKAKSLRVRRRFKDLLETE